MNAAAPELRVCALFAGIAGLELGLSRALNIHVVSQAEIDPFCRAVLAHHFPEARQYADVRDIDESAGPVDLICGGFPCQDISLAGKGEGLAGARSGLWSEYARIVRLLRPRYVVVENVAALLGRGLGRVLGDLAALGYDAWWDCIPASAVGAPHRRDRLYLVAWRVAGEVVADAVSARREGPERRESFAGSRDSRGEALANANRGRQLQREGCVEHERRRAEYGSDFPPGPDDMQSWGGVQADAQPSFCRLADGVSDLLVGRRQRLKALGNTVVPQVVEVVGHLIAMLEARRAA